MTEIVAEWGWKAAFFMGGIFVGAFVRPYLSKKGENLATKEDIEEITRKVEGVRAELAQQSYRHNIGFQTEFDILREIWAKVVDLRKTALALRPLIDHIDPNESDEERDQTRLTAWGEAHDELWQSLYKSLPFCPQQEIFDSVKELMKTTRSEAIDFKHSARVPARRDSDEYWQKAEANSEAILKTCDEICEQIRSRVYGLER